MLAFWIDGLAPVASADAARALFEIGCRIGVPFTVAKRLEGLPADAIIVRYGPAGDGQARAHLNLGFAADGAAGPTQIGGRKHWSRVGEDGVTDVVAGVAELVTAKAEASVPDAVRGLSGSFDPQHHPLARHGLLTTPLVENAAALVAEQLAAAGVALERAASPWGPGKRYAAIVTHDVDGPYIQRAFALARSAYYAFRRRNAKEFDALQIGLVTRFTGARDPYWNFADWVRLEAQYGVRSTFYVYVDRAGGAPRHFNDPRYDIRKGVFPDTLRAVHDAGAEIGVHYGIRAHGAELYAAARDEIERLVGKSAHPVGGRAHYWSIDWRDPHRSWRELEEAGFGHDASLSPMAPGFRLGSALPFLPAFGRREQPADGIVAVPTSLMDAYVTEPEFGRTLGERMTGMGALIDTVRDAGGMVVLDWHERTLANRGPWRGYLYPFLQAMDRIVPDSDAALMTMGEATAAWSAHVARLYRPSPTLSA